MANPTRNLLFLRALLIVAAVFWVFSPAVRGDWLMDDDFYLTHNALLNDPARLWKIWFAPGSLTEYYPIEASAQAIQWHLWHLDTVGYHLTNVVLHAMSALLVWRLLAKFGLRYAWLGGFLFAVHPVVVESVAWISEFKNTLSLPPFLLAMCAWIDYQERGQKRAYFLALGLFLVAMLCKITMAPFPFVILLYAWWKRGRIGGKDLASAAPFFGVSLVLGATTVVVGYWFREAHLQPTTNPPIGDLAAHLALAGQSIGFYFLQCIWPFEMIPIYPQWPINSHSLFAFWPWPILIGALVYPWTQRKSWGRHALLGLGFFLLNILPFVGFTSVSYMTFTWVMDHFLYIPLIGTIGLAVAALEGLDARIPRSMHRALMITAVAALALLAWESHDYAEAFAGPEKLWTYTIARNPTTWLAYNNLGDVMLETNRIPEAIAQYQKALQLNPASVEAHTNLGLAYFQQNRFDEAIAQYELALQVNPDFGLAHSNLGNALSREGRRAEALNHYQKALEIDPHNGDALANIAKLKAR